MKQGDISPNDPHNNIISYDGSSHTKSLSRVSKKKYLGNKKPRQTRQRQENSLDELTKSFVEYVRQSGSVNIEINDVVTKLHVKKRRIYDITNVLEGIGFIKKEAKNQITCLNPLLIKSDKDEESSDYEKNEDDLPEDNEESLKDLLEEERRLTRYIEEVKKINQGIKESKEFKEHMYLLVDDLRDLTKDENIMITVQGTSDVIIHRGNGEDAKIVIQQEQKNIDCLGENNEDADFMDSISKKHQLYIESEKGNLDLFVINTKNDIELDNDYLRNNPYTLSSSTPQILRTNINDNNFYNMHYDDNY